MFIQVLVEDKIEAGKAIQEELRRSRIPIEAAFWYRMPESGYWRLVIASKLIDRIGPIEGYERLHKALARLRLPERLADDLFGSIALLSPRDPSFQRLLDAAKGPGQIGVRWDPFVQSNAFQDAYFYDGR